MERKEKLITEIKQYGAGIEKFLRSLFLIEESLDELETFSDSELRAVEEAFSLYKKRLDSWANIVLDKQWRRMIIGPGGANRFSAREKYCRDMLDFQSFKEYLIRAIGAEHTLNPLLKHYKPADIYVRIFALPTEKEYKAKIKYTSSRRKPYMKMQDALSYKGDYIVDDSLIGINDFETEILLFPQEFI